MLQRTDRLLEIERELFLGEAQRKAHLRWQWGLGLAVLVLMTGAMLHRPDLARRLSLSAIALYYRVADPVPTTTITHAGPQLDPSAVASPRDVLAAISRIFPAHSVRLEQQGEFESAKMVPFAYESDIESIRFRLERYRPEGASTPDAWSNALARVAPLGPARPDLWDRPLAALDALDKGETIDARSRAQLVLAGCLLDGSLARLVEWSQRGESWEGSGVEVYDAERSEWFLIDTTHLIRFEQGGRRLSAYDMQKRWVDLKKEAGLKGLADLNQLASLSARHTTADRPVQLIPLSVYHETERETLLRQSPTRLLLEQFEYIVYRARNDFASRLYPPGHPIDTTRYGLLADSNTPAHPIVCPELDPREPEALYQPLNRTRIDILRVIPTSQRGRLDLVLSSCTPNFHHFEVRLAGQTWRAIEGATAFWDLSDAHLSDGKSEVFLFQARSVNRGGLAGPAAQWTIRTTPLRPMAQAHDDRLPITRVR